MRNDLRAEMFVIVMMAAAVSLSMFQRKVYDLPTALFFTLTLAFFQRRQLRAYALLFPLATLNRETSILLTLLFAVYFFRRLDRRAYLLHLVYQLVIYGTITIALRVIFADLPGQSVYFQLPTNLQLYRRAPIGATVLFLSMLAILALVWIKWRRAPQLARTAFLVFAPLLTLFFFLVGWGFEVRFFLELLPVVMIVGVS
jgi:hypothetical protein